MNILPESRLWTTNIPLEEKFLREKTVPFDFSSANPKEITELVRRMRDIMRRANGIGLAANQVGLPFRMFVAEVPSEKGNKLYAIFNPRIEKMDKEMIVAEEGCLSVPGVYGDMKRSSKITLLGSDAKGRPVKIKAWGLLARVFQHEVDHLNGTLFIDKCKHTYQVSDTDPS